MNKIYLVITDNGFTNDPETDIKAYQRKGDAINELQRQRVEFIDSLMEKTNITTELKEQIRNRPKDLDRQTIEYLAFTELPEHFEVYDIYGGNGITIKVEEKDLN